MQIVGVLGSGIVGQTLAKGLAALGYQVLIGTRDSQKLTDFKKEAGESVTVGSFDQVASQAELIFVCTQWAGTENALKLAGHQNFKDKVVVDVTNPLVFEAEGQPPQLAMGYPESAGAMLQKWLPQSKVVKAFNIVTAHYMTNARLKEGTPDLLIAGNDAQAKQQVTELAQKWGWQIIDLGDIRQAYLLEALAMIWIRYGFLNNHWSHAFKLLKQ